MSPLSIILIVNLSVKSKSKEQMNQKSKRANLLKIHLEGKLNFDFYINTLIKKLEKNVTLLQEFAVT